MSIGRKTGRLVNIGTCVFDRFVGWPVLNVTLETETGEQLHSKIIPAKGASVGYNLDAPETAEGWLQLDPTAKTRRGALYIMDSYLSLLPTDPHVSIDDIRIRPAIGDMLEIAWDYQYCTVTICEFAENRSLLIAWDIKPDGSRPVDIGTILDSLHPDRK